MRKISLFSAMQSSARRVFPPALALCASAWSPAHARAQSSPPPSQVKYIGPGSCAATACHGSVKPVAESRIFQNEYSTWILKDKHARAYQALTGDVGLRMARILKLAAKAEESPRCLACHALYTTPDERGRPFETSEGVSCENCHGPAQAWLGQHTGRESPEKHARSLALGMADTRDVIHRTEKCLSCHLGTAQKFVDHEMIAAGHPDLYFELDSFSAVMPRHWKQPRESAPGNQASGPEGDANWTGVRDWSASSCARPWSGWSGAPSRSASTIKKSGRSIPSSPALRAITPSGRQKSPGGRGMATAVGGRAIPRGTLRATSYSG